MRGNNFKEKKVVPLIFTQFCIRSHLNKLYWLTPQDIYLVCNYILFRIVEKQICSFVFWEKFRYDNFVSRSTDL